MGTKILISPNSFKECINSVKLSSLIQQELADLQHVELIVKPISDGGDGFLEVCKFHFGGEIIDYKISTPYDNSELICPVLYNNNSKTVYIESANVLGLKVVPDEFRKPLKLSSKGLGELLLKIENDVISGRFSIEKVVIGIGGTATMDLGAGACSVLGLTLFNEENIKLLPIPENFSKVKNYNWENESFPFLLDIILDVDNPLLGKDGSVRVFGKQKGVSDKDIVLIEKGFGNIVNILRNSKLIDLPNNYYGAGGGIPTLFHHILNANVIRANEFIMNDLGIINLKKSIDTVITGEGAFDKQSFMGKGAGIILKEFGENSKRIFLICGTVKNDIQKKLPENIFYIELSQFFNHKEESILNIESGIRLACIKIKNNLLL